MKKLLLIRWILALAVLLLGGMYLLMGLSPKSFPSLSERVQIIPSLVATGIGVILFWMVITIIYGRIYCGWICPIGTVTDLACRLRRFLPERRRAFRYRPRLKSRYPVLALYLAALVAGIAVVPALIEPWNLFRNVAGLLRPEASAAGLSTLGAGIGTGLLAGALSLLLVLLCAIFTGRGFCTGICPVGTLLQIASSNSSWRVEIDPDRCTACMKCEEVCPAGCVKVVGRYVDDSRCVRCMECVGRCPERAIRYQPTRNRAATPLLQSRDHPRGG